MKRIPVTGGAGFIGLPVIRHLLAETDALVPYTGIGSPTRPFFNRHVGLAQSLLLLIE